MSGISLYLKKNKKEAKPIVIYPTASLTDEEGNRVPFTFKAVSTSENNRLRDECTKQIPITGKRNHFRNDFDVDAYQSKLVAACCVEPNLLNAELQDSYGVKTPEALITSMIDNPGEFAELFAQIATLCGFDNTSEDRVEEIKN